MILGYYGNNEVLPLWDNLPKKKKKNGKQGSPGGSVVESFASAGDIVRSLIWEDCTCRGAAKPVHHSCEPGAASAEPTGWPLKPARPGARALQQEKPHNEKPSPLLPDSSPTRTTRQKPALQRKPQQSHQSINQ